MIILLTGGWWYLVNFSGWAMVLGRGQKNLMSVAVCLVFVFLITHWNGSSQEFLLCAHFILQTWIKYGFFFFLIFFAVGGLRGRDKNQYIVIIVSVILLHLLLFDLFIIISLNWLQHYFCCYVLTTNIVITNFTIQMNYCCW